jgi:putative addiction module CopG family antidote
MSREATLNVSLTKQQLRLVKERVHTGHYGSASELVRESLRMLFRQDASRPAAHSLKSQLAKAYKASAAHDRKLAREWNQLTDPWPEK